jgi:hypothetical protein
LADEWDRNGQGPVDSDVIADKLGISVEQVRSLIRPLLGLDVIKSCVGEGYAILTRHGYTQVRQGAPGVPSYGGDQVVINAPIHGSAIAINRSQAHVSNLSQNFLNNLAQEIDNHPDIPMDNKRRWVPILLDIAKNPLIAPIIDWILKKYPM